MKLEHSSVSNFYKQGLVTLVVVLLIIYESKRYYVDSVNMGDVGVRQGSGQIQVQKLPKRESVSDFVKCFLCNGGGSIIK